MQVHVAGVSRLADEAQDHQRCLHSDRQRLGFPGGAGVLHLWLDRALCAHQHRLQLLSGGNPPSLQQH